MAHGTRVALDQSELTPPMLLKNERVVVEATNEWAAMHALWIDSRTSVCLRRQDADYADPCGEKRHRGGSTPASLRYTTTEPR